MKPERMFYAHINGNQVPVCRECDGTNHGHYNTCSQYGGADKQEQAKNFQVGGDHYVTKAVQPWTAMEAWLTKEEFMGFLRGNVIKYMAREKNDALEDRKKARHYLDKLIEVMEGGK